MGDNNTGGGGSVQWSVNGHNVRGVPASTPMTPKPGQPKPHHQHGVDETIPNSRFTIRIKLPRTSGDPFLSELQAAANNPVGGAVTFTLPIEDKQSGFNPPTPDQIHIDWPSDPDAQNLLAKKKWPSPKKAGKKRARSPRKR